MIDAVLFDADGVVQHPAPRRRDAFEKLLGAGQVSNVDEFLKDVFAAEEPSLIGSDGFVAALADILAKWRCQGSLDDVLRAWTMIEVYADIMEAIQSLRRSGVGCYLATNQELHRATYMSRILGYRELFDREFYSCHIGSMKPDSSYFQGIIQELKLPASRVVFVDDHEINVTAARKVGLHAATFEGRAGMSALRQTLSQFGTAGP
jgi:putative hydrolase of the HAD superfamily